MTPDDWEDAKMLDEEFAAIVRRWVKKCAKRKMPPSIVTWALMRNPLLACLELIEEEDLLRGIHMIIDVKKGRVK